MKTGLRNLSVIAIAAVTLTAVTVVPASADDAVEETLFESIELSVDTQLLEAELAEDDIVLQDAVVDNDEVSLTALSSLPDEETVETSATVDLNSGTAVVVLDAGEKQTLYSVDIVEASEEATVFALTDVESGDTVVYSSDEGAFAAIPLVLGIPIAVAVLEKLLLATAVVVIAGVTFVAAAEAIEAIKRKESNYQHFAATIRSGQLMIGNGMSLNKAIERGRKSLNTWSRTQAGARSVAAGVKNATAVGPERDKNGSNKYCHYHPNKRSVPMHAFYGTTKTAC